MTALASTALGTALGQVASWVASWATRWAWLLAEVEETGLSDLTFADRSRAVLALLVVLAAAAYAYGARQRRRILSRLGNPALLARLVATVHPGKRLVRAVLVCVAMSFAVLGMMRLQYGGVARVLPTRGLDIVLAVDYSKSMLAQDVFPSRSERLEAELTRFLDESGRRGDRVGVVVFAGAARGFPVTSDMGVLQLFLSHADPRTENPGGTAIGKALDRAVELLLAVRRETAGERAELGRLDPELAERSDLSLAQADQIIILLTDGEDTVGRPLEVAERAAQLGIRIYTVGIGSTSGEPVLRYDPDTGESQGYATDGDGKPIMTRLDADTLEQLARATKGEYVHVGADRFGLDEVRDLVAGLAQAQREQSVEVHRDEGFAFFLAPAVVLLCIALGLGDRRRPVDGGARMHLRRSATPAAEQQQPPGGSS